jgi:transposase
MKIVVGFDNYLEERTSMSTMTIGIDIAKRVFYLNGEDEQGREVMHKKLSRERFVPFIANLPPSMIAMEAGCGAHHWARRFTQLGHEVRLIHAKFVRPFVKTNKNDWNDAAAICEAAQRPTMRFVAVKSIEQQDLLSLHRVRTRLVGQRTALCNQIRGLLAEYGIVLPQSVSRLRRSLPEVMEDGQNELSVRARQLIASLYEELIGIDERIKPYERLIEQESMDNVDCRRLRGIPGIGKIGATAVVATMGDPKVFKNGRHFAAFLGLVPRQHNSGGKSQLGCISRRGDSYVRRILIQGAHSILKRIDTQDGRRGQWLRDLVARRGKQVAAVALANKNARIAWRLLRHEVPFDEDHALAA